MTEQAQQQTEPSPVYEVTVTRLVRFIVDVEEVRKLDYEDDEDFDPQQAAEDFVDGLEGADVDNYATIDAVAPVPQRFNDAP